ncbi:DUF4870 domain-containing protein [Flavobacteriaceae bacterium AU392]|nr:DUF4870 domain-containing protein [Flavobacteriaceae bacterium]RKM85873.1 DUF4870 domain-containing protein [Flavobacteriaceae bacterium AU392]
MKENRQLIVLTHLSQLATLLLGFGSLIIPLVIWMTNRDKIYGLNAHGKSIINFQLSLIVCYIVCIPLILLFGLGLVGFLILGLLSIIYPVINAIKVSNGETPHYPLSLSFIS